MHKLILICKKKILEVFIDLVSDILLNYHLLIFYIRILTGKFVHVFEGKRCKE